MNGIEILFDWYDNYWNARIDIADIDKQIKKEIDDGIIAMPDAGEYTREIK